MNDMFFHHSFFQCIDAANQYSLGFNGVRFHSNGKISFPNVAIYPRFRKTINGFVQFPGNLILKWEHFNWNFGIQFNCFTIPGYVLCIGILLQTCLFSAKASSNFIRLFDRVYLSAGSVYGICYSQWINRSGR